MQVHGLPPVYLHKGTAILISGKLDFIHPNSINRWVVVSYRYICFLVEIKVDNPLPVGFFLDRANGNNIWIQLKWERLSDFCYKCKLLDHVTGWCKNSDPVIVTNPNGILAKLFGPWLRAANNGSILFINNLEQKERELPERKKAVASASKALKLISRSSPTRQFSQKGG